MKEIRIHGRGGQGAVLVGNIEEFQDSEVVKRDYLGG